MDFFAKLFDSTSFVPRSVCGDWTASEIAIQNVSDSLIFLAYLAIPLLLVYFIRRRPDVPFRGVFWLFVLFIVSCGFTHFMEVVLFYQPVYRLAGLVKLVTALASCGTVVALVPILPKALSMRSPDDLEREIAERRRVEETLRKATDRLALAVRGSNIGIWEVDMPDGVLEKGRVEFINLWEQLGYERPQAPTDFATPLNLLHPDDRDRLVEAMQAYLRGETREFEIEHRALHRDRAYRWMLSRGVAVRDATNKPVRFIGSSIDISDHRQAQEALRESEERFRGTFESAAVGIAHKDAEGRCLRVNQKYCDIVGYTREELLAKTFQDFTHPDDLPRELELFGRLMRGELPSYVLAKRYMRRDGSLVWIDLTVSLQRIAGKVSYAIAVLQDISERKRLEGELRQAKEAAEAANRAKDEFLANVSHEIRTPMNAILGMTEIVLDTPLNEDQWQSLQTVKLAAENLLGIINDLLDFSKIEAGKLSLDEDRFSLRGALRDSLRPLAVRAHRKGLELVCEVQAKVPDALVGDAGRLRQVLLNLVGNAIKFTETGEVLVRVERVSTAGSEKVELGFSVSDTGIGISPDHRGKIFQAFVQEDSSTTRKYGGTGLGLTIAARLVDLMGGAIAVDSQPGRGSTFSFQAAFGWQPDAPQSTDGQLTDGQSTDGQSTDGQSTDGQSRLSVQGFPVLIVDDNATNRRILEEWLSHWEMMPRAAANAAEALQFLSEGKACGRPYRLVLLDSRMPDVDGLTLAAQIRQRTEFEPIRVILLTSGDRPEWASLRELRIDAHLLKPVQQDELFDTIHRVMGHTDADAVSMRRSALPSTTSSKPLRILVAEDNEFNSRHLERLLMRHGHQVELATDGRQALDRLGIGDAESLTALPTGSTHSSSEFDLLLLDVQMPKLDGLQVVQAIRRREQAVGGHLPVIALTARSRSEDRERCLAAGMDNYLSKPIRAAELFAAIDRLSKTGGPFVPGESEGGDATGLLDPVALFAACGGDAEVLEELCKDFGKYAPGRLNEVHEALNEGDAPRLREAAHKLSGLVSAFSTVAGAMASELEEWAARQELEGANRLVESLDDMVGQLVDATRHLTLERLQAAASGSACS